MRRTFPAVIANAKSTPKALFFFLRCLCPAQNRFQVLRVNQVLLHFRFKQLYVGRVLVSGHRQAICISYDLLREQLQLPLRVQLPLLRTRRCRSPEGGILSSIPPPTRRHHHSRTRAGLLKAAREKHRAATATSVSIANADPLHSYSYGRSDTTSKPSLPPHYTLSTGGAYILPAP